jgi:hypothetical protein
MRRVVHSPRVFAAEGFLKSEECGQLIDLAERGGFYSACVRTAGNFWHRQAHQPTQISRLFERRLHRRRHRLSLVSGEA